jgi:hypothetical protein
VEGTVDKSVNFKKNHGESIETAESYKYYGSAEARTSQIFYTSQEAEYTEYGGFLSS